MEFEQLSETSLKKPENCQACITMAGDFHTQVPLQINNNSGFAPVALY
ncbi:MAG: hypothetical protein DHS20C16_08480 [Phycisphaerae bacterium]|nr:MAG: hypothetical protein DHS20C16_08480 [Phycisphaerae bacterium]